MEDLEGRSHLDEGRQGEAQGTGRNPQESGTQTSAQQVPLTQANAQSPDQSGQGRARQRREPDVADQQPAAIASQVKARDGDQNPAEQELQGLIQEGLSFGQNQLSNLYKRSGEAIAYESK